MTIVVAAIGAKALYLTFAWLGSAIVASWLSNRKGYGERPGLAAGLLLSVGRRPDLARSGRPVPIRAGRSRDRSAAAARRPWPRCGRSSTRATPRAPDRGRASQARDPRADRGVAAGVDAAARRCRAAASVAEDRARRGAGAGRPRWSRRADRPGDRGGQGGARGGGAAQRRRVRGGEAQAARARRGGRGTAGASGRRASCRPPRSGARGGSWCATWSARSRATHVPGRARADSTGRSSTLECEINPPSQRPLERDLERASDRTTNASRSRRATPGASSWSATPFDATVDYRRFRFTWARVCRPPGEGAARLTC